MKKHILYLVFFFIATISAQAQYSPNVVTEDQQWIKIVGHPMKFFKPEALLTDENYSFFFGPDTVINGKTYKEVLYKKVLYWDNYDLLSIGRSGRAMREEGGKLYSYKFASGNESLMCDFSLKTGDTIKTYGDFDFVVTQTGKAVFSTGSKDSLRYLKVRGADPNVSALSDIWVEKIGPLSTGIEWPDCWECPGGYSRVLSCCFNSQGQLYKEHSNCLASSDIKTYKGKIVVKNDSSVVFLETQSNIEALHQMALMQNNRCFVGCLEIEGITYQDGQFVEVKGIRSTWLKNNATKSDLEIISIKPIKSLDIKPVQENNSFSVSVHPNPNNGNFRVDVNRPCSLEIYTETGVLVESRKLDAGTHNFSLGTGKNAVDRAAGGTGKAAGLYILKATAADGNVISRKIAVQ